MKSMGIFILKSFTFSLIFVLVAGSISLGLYSVGNKQNAKQKTSDNGNLTEEYWRQIKESDDLQLAYKKQLERSAMQLQKQEEIITRWENVIKRMEKQIH